MSGSQKPAAAGGKRGQPIDKDEAEDLKNEAELTRQKAKIDERRRKNFNRVAEMLDQTFWVTGWRHPCLYLKERDVQTEVSEYYPELKLAVDKFYHVDDHELKLVDFKKKALEKEGIRYIFLTPQKDLADEIVDLGIDLKKEEPEPEVE